jgi:hypothetical protein
MPFNGKKRQWLLKAEFDQRRMPAADLKSCGAGTLNIDCD